jgi:hypothetical protein
MKPYVRRLRNEIIQNMAKFIRKSNKNDHGRLKQEGEIIRTRKLI